MKLNALLFQCALAVPMVANAAAKEHRTAASFEMTDPNVELETRHFENGKERKSSAVTLGPQTIAGVQVYPRRYVSNGKTKLHYILIDAQQVALYAFLPDGRDTPFVLPHPLISLQGPVTIGTEWRIENWPSERFPDVFLTLISRITDVSSRVTVPAGTCARRPIVITKIGAS